MQNLEKQAIASGNITGIALMERAGAGVVEAVFDHWPHLRSKGEIAVVLCGPGNNGGDGFVVARLLTELGWRVEVYFYGETARLPEDARRNFDHLPEGAAVHGMTFPESSQDEMRDLCANLDGIALLHGPQALFVDALFGIGLSRPLTALGPLAACWNGLRNAQRVAVDIGSGLDSRHGQVLEDETGQKGGYFCAELTVTFHRKKLGHSAAGFRARGGTVRVVDIGLTPWDHDASAQDTL